MMRAEQTMNRALLWVLLATFALSLVGCASYHPNTARAGFSEAERQCKNELHWSPTGGALAGGATSLGVHALLNHGALSGSALVGGALVGGVITYLDNEQKVNQCLRLRGY